MPDGLEIGTLWADRYRVVAPLGKGGMGTVLRAHDVTLGREVALKVAHGPLDPERLARFQREGELTSRLRHPGIVAVHAAGVTHGKPWIAYELVQGHPLGLLLDEWPVERRIEAVRDAARALGFAHAHGIVHRDVKPDNVLVDEQGRIRIMDFGVSTGLDLERLTRTGALVGTPAYMAPEQAWGVAVTPATDVWALGVMLYEALTGEQPFVGESLIDVLSKIEQGLFRPVREAAPATSRRLEAVVARALSRKPADRFADGLAFAAALEQALAPEAERPTSRPRALAAVGALVVLFAGAAVGLSRPRAPASVPQSAEVPADAAPAFSPVAAATEPPPPSAVEEDALALLAAIPAPPAEVPPELHDHPDLRFVDLSSLWDPDGDTALRTARAARDRGRHDLAASIYERVAQEDARPPALRGRAWYLLGDLFQRGQGVPPSLAARRLCFLRAAELDHPAGLRWVGETLLRGTEGSERDLPRAAALLRRARALPSEGGAWVRKSCAELLAELALDQPDVVSLDEAEAVLRAHDDDFARARLVRVLERTGRVDEAASVYSRLQEAGEAIPWETHAALTGWLVTSQPERTAALLERPLVATCREALAWRLWESVPDAPSVGSAAADALRRCAEGTGASRTAALRLVEIHGRETTARIPVVHVGSDEALRLLEALAQGQDALAVQARHWRVWVLSLAGRTAEAAATYETLAPMIPGHLPAEVHLDVLVHLGRGRPERLRELLRRIGVESDLEPLARDLWWRGDEVPGARAAATEALRRVAEAGHASSSMATIHLANIHLADLEKGRETTVTKEEVLTRLRRLGASGHERAGDARRLQVLVLERAGAADEALRLYDQVCETGESIPVEVHARLILRLLEGRPARAAELLGRLSLEAGRLDVTCRVWSAGGHLPGVRAAAVAIARDLVASDHPHARLAAFNLVEAHIRERTTGTTPLVSHDEALGLLRGLAEQPDDLDLAARARAWIVWVLHLAGESARAAALYDQLGRYDDVGLDREVQAHMIMHLLQVSPERTRELLRRVGPDGGLEWIAWHVWSYANGVPGARAAAIEALRRVADTDHWTAGPATITLGHIHARLSLTGEEPHVSRAEALERLRRLAGSADAYARHARLALVYVLEVAGEPAAATRLYAEGAWVGGDQWTGGELMDRDVHVTLMLRLLEAGRASASTLLARLSPPPRMATASLLRARGAHLAGVPDTCLTVLRDLARDPVEPGSCWAAYHLAELHVREPRTVPVDEALRHLRALAKRTDRFGDMARTGLREWFPGR